MPTSSEVAARENEWFEPRESPALRVVAVKTGPGALHSPARTSTAPADESAREGAISPLPRPRDYGEYERRRCEEQGFRMRTLYRDPLL